ncbi:MAG TPA: methyltransferase domain-containing protein [Polyangiales bacterium]|nr:methyltransferase domain-containing protein [Polyangiales bacterium]
MTTDWRATEVPAEFLERAAPEIRSEEVPDCPVCGERVSSTFAVGFDYELLTCRNPWRFVRCARCSHVWLNPRPALSELGVIYPSSYYAYSYEQTINPIAVRAKQLLDELKIANILRQLPAAPRSYLDVGCGSGRFLKALERRGLSRDKLFGLELDRQVVAKLQAEGYRVACERVEGCESIPAGALDLISMFHVIEHVDQPRAVVGKLARWLAPGGILALETPNLDSVDARLFRDGLWGGYHIPRHWHVFTPESLRALLTAAGLEVLGVSYHPGHSFWLYSLHHALRYGEPARPKLARWFDPFQGALPLLMLFTGLDKLRAALRQRTSAMLVLARKR